MKQTLRTKHPDALEQIQRARADRLEQIRAAGQHLIDNAETILGDEKYRRNLSIVIDFSCHEPPIITVSREVYPDQYIEGLTHGRPD